MTVKELKKQLECFSDEDEEVLFSYNYGDHWRTSVAGKISNIDRSIVEWSDYHNMWKLVDEDFMEDEDEDESDFSDPMEETNRDGSPRYLKKIVLS